MNKDRTAILLEAPPFFPWKERRRLVTEVRYRAYLDALTTGLPRQGSLLRPSPGDLYRNEAVGDLAAPILRRASKKVLRAGKEISVTAGISLSSLTTAPLSRTS
ncbi:hypothetical protein [Aminivibrio sp.]|jgi:hypothetical protein|uniref:hypothetical protein n=1 Tax=Aminivibrio sp. TaxID=1872489 RepID=UPI001A638583|nr:hypothetical protein [Aminivibrio sp.]MBL3539167.1 hypothetical protein [Aminivibrio sp.]MDK2959334.1 hypothetical protein [Synergistaceae bacterium]